jgi:hypothetical protein
MRFSRSINKNVPGDDPWASVAWLKAKRTLEVSLSERNVGFFIYNHKCQKDSIYNSTVLSIEI